MADNSKLFLVARREKTSIFLEPLGSDLVQIVVDTIANMMQKNPDDVALMYQGQRLDGSKALSACGLSMQGEAIVEPLQVQFVYAVEGSEGEFEPPNVVPYKKNTTDHLAEVGLSPDNSEVPPEP
eukprot:m.9507 g.9507  ORF g.9507 m.9507 type:complete len:125 (+) comp4076_c0_seq1:50-424(+)